MNLRIYINSLQTMSDLGSLAPALSYKKPSKTAKLQSSPASPPSQADSLAVPNPPAQRVVLSRRKALQDFYNLHNANPDGEEFATSTKEINREIPQDSLPSAEREHENALGSYVDDISLQVKQLNDPVELDKFIKQLDAGKILKLRNNITNGLNQHDLEKKSMVYDNYSELIKLSDTLAALNDVKSSKVPELSIGLAESVPQVTSKYIDSVLAELNSMLVSDGPVFNQEFQKVIETISASFDDADSLASVKGING